MGGGDAGDVHGVAVLVGELNRFAELVRQLDRVAVLVAQIRHNLVMTDKSAQLKLSFKSGGGISSFYSQG